MGFGEHSKADGSDAPRERLGEIHGWNLSNLQRPGDTVVASRVGEGTKLVLTGDATQIDNPYLDSSSNGLSYLVERLKGKSLVGHVTLAKSERSDLASLVTAEL